MQHLSSINKIEYFLDEIVQEDCLTQTETQISDLCWKGGEAREVSQLGPVTEVEQQMSQVGASLSQFIENINSDQVTRQFQVFQINTKSDKMNFCQEPIPIILDLFVHLPISDKLNQEFY